MFWSWKLKKQLINSGLAARKVGGHHWSSCVLFWLSTNLVFWFSLYLCCVYMNCWHCIPRHLLLPGVWGRKEIRRERITHYFSRYDSPEQPSRWCFVCDASMYGSITWEYKSCARERCGGVKCDTTSNELEMKKPVPTQSSDVYIHTMKHIWAHSNPLTCTLLTGSIRVKKKPQAI